MFITSKNKYLSNDMKIFGTCSIPLTNLTYVTCYHVYICFEGKVVPICPNNNCLTQIYCMTLAHSDYNCNMHDTQ